MSIETENMENTMNSLVYEQPTLKNYGTMKEFTLSTGGSFGDNLGPGAPDVTPDAINLPSENITTPSPDEFNTDFPDVDTNLD
ncbi:MAG: hypothetical protein F6K55_04745 [Moorea sp. SIO4A3]|nr:hypothetical protein [Moorena sp. SIO4A3]